MKGREFSFRTRPLAEMPKVRQSDGSLWDSIVVALHALDAGEGLYLEDPDGPKFGRDLMRMRANVAGSIQRREGAGRWLCVSDFTAGAVWIVARKASNPQGGVLAAALPPVGLSAAQEAILGLQRREQPEVNPLAFDGVGMPVACTCPGWWIESPTWKEGKLDQPGYHHHESCPLHDRKIGPSGEPRCTCDAWHREDSPHFKVDVANEGHELSCPLYRTGAHFWPIPPVTAPGEPYIATCPWCKEEREFKPFDQPVVQETAKVAAKRGRPTKA